MTKPIDPRRPMPAGAPAPETPGSGLLRRAGTGLLMLAMAVVVLVSALPVLLLPFITSVPLIIAAALLLVDAGIVYSLIRLGRTPALLAGALLGIVLVSGLAVVLSQRMASTPPITDVAGRVTPGSIASLEAVELNGSRQWLTIRGRSADLPVLLFLAGGPGGSELAMTRRYLSRLEEHFVVVNWDQPGTGKSYGAVPSEALTPERYVADAHALTLHLRQRFGQERIYLYGESWGSILGVWLVQRYPELYRAFVSTGQMVDPIENDIMGYEFAIALLTEQGRLEEAEGLRRNGPPPYERGELLRRFMATNGVLDGYMSAHAHGEGSGHNLFFDSMRAPEYGLLDKVNWARGLASTFSTVYPHIYDVDFRTQATQLEVPVYFIVGRWDVNAMTALTEEYFALLEAPHKELIRFEDSAHTPMWDEPQRFVRVMVDTVLAQNPPAGQAGQAHARAHQGEQP